MAMAINNHIFKSFLSNLGKIGRDLSSFTPSLMSFLISEKNISSFCLLNFKVKYSSPFIPLLELPSPINLIDELMDSPIRVSVK